MQPWITRKGSCRSTCDQLNICTQDGQRSRSAWRGRAVALVLPSQALPTEDVVSSKFHVEPSLGDFLFSLVPFHMVSWQHCKRRLQAFKRSGKHRFKQTKQPQIRSVPCLHMMEICYIKLLCPGQWFFCLFTMFSEIATANHRGAKRQKRKDAQKKNIKMAKEADGINQP